jgi:hypothetical protein
MFDQLFLEYTEHQDGPFFQPVRQAGETLENAIQQRFSPEEYVKYIEEPLSAYVYELERAAFYTGLSHGLCTMGAAANVIRKGNI